MLTSFVGELCLRLHRARSYSSVTSNFSSVYCNCVISMVLWIPKNLGNLIDELHLLILPSLTSSCAQSGSSCVTVTFVVGASLVGKSATSYASIAGSSRFFCCAQVLVLTLSFLVSCLVLASCRSALSRSGCSFTSCRSALSRCRLLFYQL